MVGRAYTAETALQDIPTFMERYLQDRQFLTWYEKALEGDDKQRMILVHPGSGKTTLAQAIMLNKIAKNRKYKIGIFSKAKGKAENYMSALEYQLKHNKKLIEDFGPFWRQDLEWNTTNIRVIGSDLSVHTPTVSNMGVTGQVEGLRFDMIMADDPMDLETFLSPAEMDKMKHRFTVWKERLMQGGELWVIGHRFGPDDFYNYVEEQPGVKSIVLEAYREDQEADGTHATLVPELWPWALFEEQIVKRLKTWELEAHYQQKLVAPEDCPLRWEWFEREGQYVPWEHYKDLPVEAAYDPAYSDKGDADYSASAAGIAYQGGMLITALDRKRITSNWAEVFVDFANIHSARVLHPEDNNAKTLPNEMRKVIGKRALNMTIRPIHSTMKKEFRLGNIEAPARQGRIWFAEPLKDSEELKEFRRQWVMYPNLAHDDVLDVVELLWSRLQGQSRMPVFMEMCT